jgi:RNA polymerase sigma-70 factor (ECF subfamily)
MTTLAAPPLIFQSLSAPVRASADQLLEGFDELDASIRRRVRRIAARAASTRSRGTIAVASPAARRTPPMAIATDRSDETLLTDYLSGDRGAFAALVERYRRELHGFLAKFLGSNAAADDVFQETFLQVHLAARTFDPERTFKPWLFTIAANKARDWHRRQKRRRAVSLDAPTGTERDGARMVDLMESDEAAPPDSLGGAEMRTEVKRIVDDMPALYREVLQLNYFQRMSYQQISDVLGIPLGTVKSRLHAATATFADQWRSACARHSRGRDGAREPRPPEPTA